MPKLKVNDLKKHLQGYDQGDLVRLIVELAKKSKEAENYLAYKVYGQEAAEEQFHRALKMIREEFFPDRGEPKMRLVDTQKAITDFKKSTGDKRLTVSLMLYYVEMGTEFTDMYGDIDERFYNSMASMYAKIAEECEKDEAIFREFGARMYHILDMAQSVGWGYPDMLAEIYYEINWTAEEEEEDA